MSRDPSALRPRRGKAFWVLLLGAALSFVAFLALGSWQVQRLGWKQDLIARVEARLAAAPVPPPARADWPAVDKAGFEYRKLRLAGRFEHGRETLVGASTELGSGFWVLTPLRLADGGWLLVNRGFVPPSLRDPASRREGQIEGEIELTGLLRLSEPLGSLLQKNEPAAGRWYSRDVAAIAAARGLEGPVAPFFVDAAGDPQAEVWPRPGLTVLRFSNNHRVYALTWFALAAMAAGAAVYLLREQRRRPQDPPSHRELDP
ncbi:SURF1 family protein [Roseateles sp. DAIF2]|uniref:SURF1 family protein n=1 Tax=Roseateles sp. DAIF2 TaxID=2714952 RepID=UPI0018A24AAD|nr:SURF1 family protein [Roseateles sp. DAIF2]QPF73587.1 SURF1 family protein [Roseateles sp. DAIF2]